MTKENESYVSEVGKEKIELCEKTKTGKYYVSILVQEEIQMLPPVGGEIGIDLGIKDLLVLSNGVRIGNPKWLRDN